MEYTPSQIWKLKEKHLPIIRKALETIEEYAPYISTDEGYNIQCKMNVDGALVKLDESLDIICDLIIDTKDFELAPQLDKEFTHGWEIYCSFVNRGEFEAYEPAYRIQKTIDHFRDWRKKNEPKPVVNSFLAAFESLAHDCIAFIGFKYGTRTEKPKKQTDIVSQFEVYGKTVTMPELLQEIKSRIENSKTPLETDQYINSLLFPFKEFCEVLRPSEPSFESKMFVKLLCTSAINHEKEKPGTIECCLRCMLSDMNDFARRLYDVLIQNGINLNECQRKTGVYFRKVWNPANGMFFNVGDWDLIESLPLVEEEGQNEEKKNVSFQPNSDEFVRYLVEWRSSMLKEGIIEEIPYNEFVRSIYDADFSSMYVMAEKSRNKKRLFLLIGRIKTWFSSEWEEQVAKSMGIELKKMRNVTVKEIKSSHTKWYKTLDETFPKCKSEQ